METLSLENIYDIALNLNPGDLSQLCLTDKRFSNVCNDDYFWRLKLEKDYPNIGEKPDEISWKEYYRLKYLPEVLLMIKATGDYYDLIDYEIVPRRLSEYVLEYFDEYNSITLNISKHETEEFKHGEDLTVIMKDKPSDIKYFQQLFGKRLSTIPIIETVAETYLDILADEGLEGKADELDELFTEYMKR